ncbi:putative neurogenic locus Notch protein-like [Apostichopus japonicus]|uniref:Putative neurogenic locus Notch protein-like n=1 Tax=Stichopus japonicus TaxID=307972 RepID=A0A2G8KDI6_STIJA|nr:putative neurogenic locus Notch protein-like [Apostichopus japonicus]
MFCSCSDLDECSSSPCVNGFCLNEGNMFRCICPVVFTGTLCESLIEDSCSSDPCRNGGNCVVGDDSSYQCQCVNGWTGTNCAEDLDECSSSPCVNGICLNEGNMFRCICPVVFTGTLCESLIEDSCSSDPCRNGGNCVVGDDSSYQCQCVNGWTGTNCAEDLDECSSSPCVNGFCLNEGNMFRCICPVVFTGTLCESLIEDSCSSDPCRNGGNCVVGDDSSYQCQCVNGWTGTNCAEDLDECSSSPCVNGFCLNEGNMFRCICPVVFTGTLCESLIEDSCSSDPCRNGGNCVVGDDSSYQCQCVNGWTGTNCAEDLDECSSSPCVNGICLNEGNMFRCICPVVFTGTLCESLIEDSCSSDPCRNGGNCVVGDDSSYQCQCVNGWTGTNCAEDLDECSSSPCVNGICLNEGNMFRCICPVVFTGTLCESLIEDSCSSDPCRNGGNCVVGDDSSYQCQCVNGWTGTNCAEDLDECSSSPCVNGFCLNEGNMFRCICPVVFTGTLCESLIEDSCSSDPCRNGGNCVVGDDSSYQCQCVNGWTGTNCAEDLDECSSSPCVNGFCLNEGNMFRCICPVVFTGTLCESLIEDSCSSDPCRNGGNCVVGDDSSYQCQCVNGWTGTNCAEDSNDCSSNPCLNGATCIDGVQRYTCVCMAGYLGTNCETGTGPCAVNPCFNEGTCVVEGNNFRCLCGPFVTGTVCLNPIEDPCSSSPCQSGGTCVLDGSGYVCRCLTDRLGINCELPEPCTLSPCQNGGLCSSDPSGSYTCACSQRFEGTNCELPVTTCATNICVNGGTCSFSGDFMVCDCPPGFTGSNCAADVNECLTSPCLNGGNCNNVVGSYNCDCLAGYGGDHCEEDPCAGNPCGGNGIGTCTVSQTGDVVCDCQPGFAGTTGCVDVDECTADSNPCMNGGQCLNRFGTYTCNCPDTHTGVNCESVICSSGSLTCQNEGVCIVEGSVTSCLCAAGYTGIFCEEVFDSCASNPCVAGKICSFTAAGYECNCPSGLAGDACDQDINECINNPCENNGICQDEFGSFACQCMQGYEGPLCEIFNPCRSNPCLNDGRCAQSADSYFCICLTEFEGDLCQVTAQQSNVIFDTPWIVAVICAALLTIFILLVIVVFYHYCSPKKGPYETDRQARYDAERASHAHQNGSFDTDSDVTPNGIPTISKNSNHPNEYGFVPQNGSRSTIAEINSYENPWPISTEDFEPPRTVL